jgi:hypothetical protein
VSVPELEPGDVVVMDNRRSHKGTGARVAIQVAGASLPPRAPVLTGGHRR